MRCRRTKAEKILFQNLTYLFFLPCRSFIMYTPVHFFGPPKAARQLPGYGRLAGHSPLPTPAAMDNFRQLGTVGPPPYS